MRLKTYLSLFLIFSFLSIATSQKQEYIKRFDVEIQLNKDRSINVEENIRVYVAGDEIKRGLTRSLPDSRSIDDKWVDVEYQNLKVFKDGEPEPYTKKETSSDDIYYIGDKDILLEPGYYQYVITYSVPNQIIYDDDKVQLRWNAIGTDVMFKSEKAKVTVKFEEEMKFLDAKMYIGKYGSGQNGARVKETRQNNEIVYNIDEGLTSNEAVTIEIDLASESVVAPTFFQKNSSLLTMLLGGLFMFFYFITTWFKYGRDPKANLSPASINYISKNGYKARGLTSSLIALATKGFIKISSEGESSVFKKTVFVVEKLRSGNSSLPVEELSILQNLFVNNSIVYLDGEYRSEVNETRKAHQLAVENQHKAFIKQGNNWKFVLYPFLIFVLVLIVSNILANTIEINSYPHFKNLLVLLDYSTHCRKVKSTRRNQGL